MNQIQKGLENNNYKQQFILLIKELSHDKHVFDVWRDFNEAACLSLASVFEKKDYREERYKHIMDKYTSKEQKIFPQLLSNTILAMDEQYQDFLGQVYMELKLGDEWKGQIFTPYHLCKMIAQLTLDMNQFEGNNIVTMNEPCSGGGAMIVAMCDFLNEKKINFQKQLYITAQDVDFLSVCMTFIQMSIIGCKGVVIHGNSLSNEQKEIYYTPMTYLTL